MQRPRSARRPPPSSTTGSAPSASLPSRHAPEKSCPGHTSSCSLEKNRHPGCREQTVWSLLRKIQSVKEHKFSLQGLKSLLTRLDKTVPSLAAKRRATIGSPGVRRTNSVMKRASVVADARRASTAAQPQDPAARRASTIAQPLEPAAVSKPEAAAWAQAENARPSISGDF